MNKKANITISILAALLFLINSILWWSDGNTIAGILLAAAALIFGFSGFIQIKNKNNGKK